MIDKMALDDLINQNPNVDKDELEKSLRATKALEDLGVKQDEYSLSLPFEHDLRSRRKRRKR